MRHIARKDDLIKGGFKVAVGFVFEFNGVETLMFFERVLTRGLAVVERDFLWILRRFSRV